MSEKLFPWGDNRPTRAQRVLVALLIASIAASMQYFVPAGGRSPSDFSPLWHGAKALLAGQDPYALIGPEKTLDLPSAVNYPAPALLLVSPLTVFPEILAGTLFVFISSALLAFGATRAGWQLLPIFPSIVFMTSARIAQWSILMTAVVFIPLLGFIGIAKPTASFPAIASSSRRSALVAAAAGFVVLVGASLLIAPSWPARWWAVVQDVDYFQPPILTLRGAAIALVLLRWRREEAWLVFLAACMPQTWYPYNGLMLLAVARTYREACFLSLLSSAGWLVCYQYFVGGFRSEETRFAMQSCLIAVGYLPAVLLVLGRPNIGPGPAWLEWISSRRSSPSD